MNKCIKVKRLLSRYLDKEASVEDAKFVENHLDECFLCKNSLLELSSVKSLLRGKEKKSLPENYLVCRLREVLADKEYLSGRSTWLGAIGNFSFRLIPVPVAVIALAFTFLMFTPSRYESEVSLEEHMLSSNSITTQTALELVFGT
jgi:predicted anti-sigma-YlaC factor YlaD